MSNLSSPNKDEMPRFLHQSDKSARSLRSAASIASEVNWDDDAVSTASESISDVSDLSDDAVETSVPPSPQKYDIDADTHSRTDATLADPRKTFARALNIFKRNKPETKRKASLHLDPA